MRDDRTELHRTAPHPKEARIQVVENQNRPSHQGTGPLGRAHRGISEDDQARAELTGRVPGISLGRGSAKEILRLLESLATHPRRHRQRSTHSSDAHHHAALHNQG